MATDIQICNLALSRVGAPRITSLTDNTKEAKECATLLPLARDATLEAHDWSFARKRQALAESTDEYSGWDYAYDFPADCVVPRRIYTDGADKIEYEVAVNGTLSKNVILTNQYQAELIYTARVTNYGLMSAMAVDALAWRLAADLAYSLLRKTPLQQSCLTMFNNTVGAAAASNANADNHKQPEKNPFVEARS